MKAQIRALKTITYFFPILFLTLANLFGQTKNIAINVNGDEWATGDICSDFGSTKIYEGNIEAGNERILSWIDLRGWAEFEIPSTVKNSQINKITVQFYVLDESSDNNHLIPGSHNLVITKFPFDVRINSASEIADYFDNMDYYDREKNYGVNWVAGETVGLKEVTLSENAVKDMKLLNGIDSKFRIGFWEYDDNASRCTIAGRNSESPPKLLIQYE